ncbi:MAG: 2-dehydro-3-deoxy-6-phosphogalactonate aldolase [Campylobacteraceae bacterium]|nr:2-dehydro-3-deoxy-6-phosphogalactonate aldolase [Campylobacteraceae bacterium]
MNYNEVLDETRLIAILRGITPSEILGVAKILVKSGFKIIEVPLNSPDAFKSIKMLVDEYKNDKDIFIGAGTVCTVKDVETLKETGASLVISPNVDAEVIKRSRELNLISSPGFLTPSEAYIAIKAGAHSLKLFPFKRFGIGYYNDIKVIIPKEYPLVVVGGVDEENISTLLEEGVEYFGLGSSLYKPSMDLGLLKTKADFFVKAIKNYYD